MKIWRTCDISTDDRFERNDLGLFHEHRASLERLPVHLDLGGHLADVGRDKMCGDDMPEFLEPEERNLREHLALVRHALDVPTSVFKQLQSAVVAVG